VKLAAAFQSQSPRSRWESRFGSEPPLWPFPVDRRRIPELTALGCRVVDELADDWRGEFMVLMVAPAS